LERKKLSIVYGKKNLKGEENMKKSGEMGGLKAHKASTAMIRDMGDLAYSGEQHGNGSMDYDKIKKHKAAKDAARMKKYGKSVMD